MTVLGPADLLEGTTVVDLGVWRPAPFCCQLLAELGAEVTKVEPPGGDPMRAFPDLYRTLNERKRVVELDLKSPSGRSVAADLIGDADVVVEGFRPGVAHRLGVGFETVTASHPTLVYCSISGFGQDGPLADAPGHDLSYQAWAGMLSGEGTGSAVPVADLAGGTYGAMAVCAALAARERTGTGRRIDVPMTDVLFSWAAPAVGGDLASGADPAAGFPAYGTFACRDGALTLAVVTEDHFWDGVCEGLGLDDLVGIAVEARAVRGRELRERLTTALADRDRDDVVGSLLAAGVPVAPVLGPVEATTSAHARARGLAERTDDGWLRVAHPVRFT